MSTMVCQGLQSCLEPRLIEPLIFKHTLANPKPNPTIPTHKETENKTKNINENGNLSVWSFIQSLATPQSNPKKAYIHPVATQSSSALSKQSLDMCTESLGNETGTHEYSSLFSTSERDQYVCPSRPRGFAKKMLRSRNFPPPLISSHSVQVRPHRENGRLIIKAIKKTSETNYFQTERKNGSLKLTLVNENSYSTDDEQEVRVGINLKMVENIGLEIEEKNMCKEEENEKSGISSLGTLFMATS